MLSTTYVTADNGNGSCLSSKILIKATKNEVHLIDGGKRSIQLKQTKFGTRTS